MTGERHARHARADKDEQRPGRRGRPHEHVVLPLHVQPERGREDEQESERRRGVDAWSTECAAGMQGVQAGSRHEQHHDEPLETCDREECRPDRDGNRDEYRDDHEADLGGPREEERGDSTYRRQAESRKEHRCQRQAFRRNGTRRVGPATRLSCAHHASSIHLRSGGRHVRSLARDHARCEPPENARLKSLHATDHAALLRECRLWFPSRRSRHSCSACGQVNSTETSGRTLWKFTTT